MIDRSTFSLIYARDTIDHIHYIDRKYHPLIRKEIREQLKITPNIPTRNRKMLAQPTSLGATWELRFGPGNRFRVFYEIDLQEKVVWILAIGIKMGNRLWIGGEEYKP